MCISKVVDELKAQRQQTFQFKIRKLKKENNLLSTENTELKAKLSRLNSEVTELISDSIQRSSSCKLLQVSVEDLNEAYDLLTAKNSQMMNNKAEETKKLLEKLQNKRRTVTKRRRVVDFEQNLSVKQKELLQTQKELFDREQKVLELQSIINKKRFCY